MGLRLNCQTTASLSVGVQSNGHKTASDAFVKPVAGRVAGFGKGNVMPTQRRTDLIDFITPSRRGHLTYRRILQEAALDPQRWMRHHFIVVFDDDNDDNVQALLRWLDKARETMVLPRVSATNAPAGSADVLRQLGFSIGSNPYVYFQDDDDPLPLHLDSRMAMMEYGHLDAVFGATETVTERGTVVEQFPRIVNGRFASD